MKNRRRMVVSFGLVVLVVGSILWSGCSRSVDAWEETEGEGVRVLVSFPPLYCFARKVAGDHAKVISLTQTVGPHHYTPTSHDVILAAKADLFLVNGLGLDDWITQVKNSAGNKKLKVVKVAEAVPEKKRLERSHEHDHGHGHSHGDSPYDPHAWLGIDEAVIMVEKVRDVLSEADPRNRNIFYENAKKFVKELRDLKAYGESKFAGKANKRLIATHDSLRYFGRCFGLTVVDNIQPQPGREADAAHLKDVMKHLTDKRNPVRIITVEPQYSKATAETLIRQVNNSGADVELVVFDTLETVPSRSELTADFYARALRANIDNLAKAMK